MNGKFKFCFECVDIENRNNKRKKSIFFYKSNTISIERENFIERTIQFINYFIILYIYATIGAIVFSNSIPERWSDVGVSMITLFQVLTLSSWEQVMLPLQDIYWWAWIYFFSFIIVCAITMLNLLIAILVDVVVNQNEKKDDVIKTKNNAEKLNEQFSEEISLDKLKKDQ